MKTRQQTAIFVQQQLGVDHLPQITTKRDKQGKHHYGWQELRELMDFIYEGEPTSEKEMLINDDEYRKPY